MSEPIPYQTPLPPGLNLRFQELPDGVRVSRDVVAQSALWREGVAVVIAIGVPIALIIIAVGWSIKACYDGLYVAAIPSTFLVAAGAVYLPRFFRYASQNGGIITDIAATEGTLYWRKQMPWGARDTLWPLSSVRAVEVDPVNRMLRIHRWKGPSLAAFSFHRRDELVQAAALLNRAIEMHCTETPGP